MHIIGIELIDSEKDVIQNLCKKGIRQYSLVPKEKYWMHSSWRGIKMKGKYRNNEKLPILEFYEDSGKS